MPGALHEDRVPVKKQTQIVLAQWCQKSLLFMWLSAICKAYNVFDEQN